MIEIRHNCREKYTVLVLICCMISQGCATTPYRYGSARSARPIESSSADVAFEFGQPRPTMDRMRKVVDYPKRLFCRESSHLDPELSARHREQLAQYLSQNDLTDVRVLVNRYDPWGEWQRLRTNDRVGPGWRYTAGILSVASYTLVPGRVFGYQHYNPYTNSLSVNSDRVASAVFEAAYAKEIHASRLPGTYAAATQLPGVSLWKTSHAVNDVLGYATVEDNWELEHETYHECFPRIASGVVAPAQFFVTPVVGFIVMVGGGVLGHAVGNIFEARRLAE
ncbi:MAG: hypothetical protein JWM11_6089, partial [Planctomycetaceae bacterium]|nr:hypothetical protein [Planctomycetaceae bacterium]